MGKISTKDSRDGKRHVPLYKDIAESNGVLFSDGKKKKKSRGKRIGDEDLDQGQVLDASTSRKVLQLAKEQQEEIEREENIREEAERPRFSFISEENDLGDYNSDEEDAEEIGEEEYYEDDADEDEEEDDMSPDDIAMFEAFVKGKRGDNLPFESINLADKIMEKIAEKESMKIQEESESFSATQTPSEGVLLPPRVIAAYEKVGDSLRAWTHGKLPKLFKVLPTIKNWEDLLYVTAPESWTPNAIYEATRLFISNLNSNKAERFVNLVLFPRFRQDIEQSENHKLNYHLFRALKKSLYKPSAFFKGFLFPLVDEHCTVREAMIAAGVLTKTSIPVQHASVALSWLLEQEYSPAATVFIRVLVEKKYALPYQTIDDLVFYFMRFRIVTDNKSSSSHDIMDDVDDLDLQYSQKVKQAPPLPIVWHKAFLAFAQRYKNDITDDQRDFLMETIRQRSHKSISKEIRRELLEGKKQAQRQELKKDDEDVMSYF